MKLIPEFNNLFTNIETVFNCAAALPFLGVPSSVVRVTFGVAQMHIGVGFGVACGIRQLRKDKILNHDWKYLSKVGFEHALHGILNIIRGLGEMLIGIFSAMYTYGAANSLMLPFNYNSGFRPIVYYGFWSQPGVDPLKHGWAV